MTLRLTHLALATLFLLLIIENGSINAQQAARRESTFPPLEERLQTLTDISLKKPMIRLNPEKFRQYIGTKTAGQPVRNYSFVVMLTALSPMRQCSVCRAAADEFQIVANSWRYSSTFQPNLFFGYVDYDDGSDIFQQLGLNSAPVFLYFGERSTKGASLSLKNADQMDIQRIGFGAETIARWVAEKTSIQIRVMRPPNYAGLFLLLVLFTGCSVLLYVRRNNLDFLYNKTIWGLIALTIVFAMTSGQMWSHIRSPPLMQKNSQGGISYIHGSSSGQFIIETYIIFIINVAITVGMIMMVESMKSGKVSWISDPKKRKYIAGIGLLLVAFFFSLLLSIFRSKAGGYPYSFLFK